MMSKVNFHYLFIIPLLCSFSFCSASKEMNRNDKIKAASDLEKFNFSVAIAFEHYKVPYIHEAETLGDSRVVSITDQSSNMASLWLQTHYIFNGLGARLKRTNSAPGFFVGVRAVGAESQLFDAFGLGVMWAFKRTSLTDAENTSSINIGFGPVWHRTRTLADGIIAGQPLPEHFNDIKYKKRDEISWMLNVSVGF